MLIFSTMIKPKLKLNYLKVFAQIFLFLFVINTVFYAPYNINYTYAQESSLENYPDDYVWTEEEAQAWFEQYDYNFGGYGQGQRGAQTGGNQDQQLNVYRMPGAETMNLLYPVGPPNDVSFENITADFVSCIGAMMAVNLMQTPMRLIQRAGSSIGEALFNATNSSGTWHLGAAAVAVSGLSEQRVQVDEESVQNLGVTMFGAPVFLSGADMAFCAKNVVYSYLTGTVIRWVNTAFNDAAVWVEDIAATLNNVYAISYREAIGEINLCVDISAAVNVAVDLDFLKTQPVPPRTGCTISVQERAEVRAMLSGESFSINAFEKLYSNPSNNAMGGFLITTSLANQKAGANEQSLLLDLNWGNGWWPFRDQSGKVVTPGQVIQNKVADLLQVETNHHMLADSWNQVIFLITNQLLRKEIGNVQSPMSM